MSLTKNSAGDDFFRYYNLRPYAQAASYGSPNAAALGDLVRLSSATQDAVQRCAAGENPLGIVISINASNGTLSVAEFTGGVTIILEYTGSAPVVGDPTNGKVWSNGDRGTIYTSRDRVTRNSSGTGIVIAVDAASPAGTGTAVVRWP